MDVAFDKRKVLLPCISGVDRCPRVGKPQMAAEVRLARLGSQRHDTGDAMIRNDAELAADQAALGHVQQALDSLRTKLLPHSPTNFAIYSEGYVEQIDILQMKINEYLARKTHLPVADGGIQSTLEHPTLNAS